MESSNPLSSDPSAANANLSDSSPVRDNWQSWLDSSAQGSALPVDGIDQSPPVKWSSSDDPFRRELQSEIGFGVVVRRFFARAIDIATWCVLFAVAVVVMLPFGLDDDDETLAVAFLTFVAAILLEWLCRSRTLGKLVAGLRIVDATGDPIRWKGSSLRVLLLVGALAWLPLVVVDREGSDSSLWSLFGGLSLIFSGGLSLIGFAMVIVSNRRRAPWDMIARSQVRQY